MSPIAEAQLREQFEKIMTTIIIGEGGELDKYQFNRNEHGRYNYVAVERQFQAYQAALTSPQVTRLVEAALNTRRSLTSSLMTVEGTRGTMHISRIKQHLDALDSALTPFTQGGADNG